MRFVLSALCLLASMSSAFAAGGTPPTPLDWRVPGEQLVYRSCGCADACWVAEVRDRRTSAVKARLRCDCETLHFERVGGAAKPVVLGTCDTLNGSDRKGHAIGAALDGLLHPPAGAPPVAPLTPSLDDPTRTALLDALAATGFPEVGRNSVLIAITSALGFEPAASTSTYDLPYDHLPKVSVVASVASTSCTKVEAVATGSPGSAYRPTTVTGTYCLAGAARWTSTDQRVAAP